MPGVLASPALPLSPREGVASGRLALVSASFISLRERNAVLAAGGIVDDDRMHSAVSRSVWSNSKVGPSLPMAAVL